MGQLIVSVQMTLDGVIDNSDQWFAADDDHNVGSDAQLRAADSMLLGRVTFEGLSQVWPTMTDGRGFADRVNAMPKYVVARTLAEPLGWNGRLLAPDLLSQVAALKNEMNLIVYGCGPLAARSGLDAGTLVRSVDDL